MKKHDIIMKRWEWDCGAKSGKYTGRNRARVKLLKIATQFFVFYCAVLLLAPRGAGQMSFDNPTNLPVLSDFTASDSDVAAWCEQLIVPEERVSANDTESRMILHNASMHAETDPALRGRLLKAFRGVLASDRPDAIKEFILDQLRFFAGEESLEAMRPFLTSERLCDRAARVIVNVGTPAAAAVLREEFSAHNAGKTGLCLAHALGMLPDSGAVPALLDAAKSDDAELRLAALHALAASGDERAAGPLLDAARAGDAFFRAKAADCYLAFLREQATAGAGEKAVERALSFLDECKGLRHVWYACLEVCGIAGGERATRALLEAWADVPDETKPEFARVLASQAGGLPIPVFLDSMKAGEPDARAAVLDGLTLLGIEGGATVSEALARLIEAAGSADASESRAARAAMARLRGHGVEHAMMELAADASATIGTRREMIRMLADRRAAGAAAVMLKAVREPDKELRMCALRGLAAVAETSDAPAVLDLVKIAGDDSERDEAARALAAISGRAGDAGQTAGLIVAAIDKFDGAPRAALLRILGGVGGEAALEAARRALTVSDEAARDAAVRALSEWPDASPIEDMLKLASEGRDEIHRALAVGAYARMVGLKPGLAPEETSDMYEKAADLAERDEERRAISAMRRDMIRSLASRNPPGAVGVMLKTARDKDQELRMSALRGLCAVAATADGPAVMELVNTAASDLERDEAVNALVAIGRRQDDSGKTAGLIVSAVEKNDGSARAALVRALGRVGGGAALDAARRAMAGSDETARDAAVRALSEWSDASPMDDLLALAVDGKSDIHRILALGGYARMIALKPGLKPDEMCDLYENAMELAERDEERRLILGMLGKVPDPRALKYLETTLEEHVLLGEESLVPEIEAAYVDVAVSLAKTHPREAREALQQFCGASKNEKQKERALQAIRSMD